MWQMREDPLMYQDIYMEYKEHRKEYIKGENGKPYPPTRPDVLRNNALFHLTMDTVMKLELFTDLSRQATEVRKLHASYETCVGDPRNGFAVITATPHRLIKAIHTLRHALEYATRDMVRSLSDMFIASAPWRPLFFRTDAGKPDEPVEVDQRDYDLPPMDRQLYMLVYFIVHIDEDATRHLGISTAVDELERFLTEYPELGKRLITALVARVIGDLSVTTQCLQLLEMYYPPSPTDGSYEEALTRYPEIHGQQTKWRDNMLSRFKGYSGKIAGPFVDPFLTKFPYPIFKPRTKENVEHLRRAEANLDALWNSIDGLLGIGAGDETDTAGYRFLYRPRTLRRTPPWSVETDVVEKQEVKLVKVKRPIEESMARLLSEPAGEGKRESPKAKKVKTRGTAAEQRTEGSASESEVEEELIGTICEVDARSLKVFQTIFFVPNVSATPGEIPWTDFCYAMTHVGFTVEKGYGSAWNFYPQRVELDRPIQFHEPHPKVKIPYEIARRHGRRLNRAYGWSRESFCLKGEAASELTH